MEIGNIFVKMVHKSDADGTCCGKSVVTTIHTVLYSTSLLVGEHFGNKGDGIAATLL
jgi:hypothetical protein